MAIGVIIIFIAVLLIFYTTYKLVDEKYSSPSFSDVVKKHIYGQNIKSKKPTYYSLLAIGFVLVAVGAFIAAKGGLKKPKQ